MSLEAWIAVGIILIFFIATLILVGQIHYSSNLLDAQASQWNECQHLSALMQETFIQGPGTQIRTTVSVPFAVTQNGIVFLDAADSATCTFRIAVQNATLEDGNVLIYNSNGMVVLENA